MKNLLGLVFICLSLVGTNAYAQRSSEPIINYENISVITESGKPTTDANIKAAITRAAENLNWKISDAGAGKLLGTLVVNGKHTVTVTIPYSQSAFSILYKDSINMKYNPSMEAPDFPGMYRPATPISTKTWSGTKPVIHPFYNVWTQNLLERIKHEIKNQ
ncbi:MAG: hypothetical protein H6R18_1547 [Proteobacteria bacterium]|nr:hypothetical protein [Pseudomonadota bacterium]